ncbi:MAG TPA: FAD-dependent oxidoreductase [Acidobacteriota bacterium]|nr:FAD-dependent oxidoreductase [Acidobacteriota bacterium]
MNTVAFSSWNGKILDNRKGAGAKAAKTADLKLPAQYGGKKIAALMGWNGMVVTDPKADVLSLTLAYLKEARRLSCGECSVCMIGIDKVLSILKDMDAGKGSKKDIVEIETIAGGVAANAKCNFGRATALAPVLDAVKYFKTDFTALAEGKAKLAEKSYGVGVTAPCMQACPARLDIPGYIELIRNDRFCESLDLIRERCILPGVIGRACTHPCESACVRKDIDEPLAIRLLKRAVADANLAGGAAALPAPGETKKEKIAVIGAGPAGLAAAYHLRLMGYPVTVFEALPRAGGMATVGIPDYRLPKDVLNHETDLIKRMGVAFKYNSKIEKLNWADLKKQGYKALFLAIGAHVGTKIGCEGEDAGYDGFVQGAEFLRLLSLGGKVLARKKVVIIGGGNVALDCARSCARLGFEEVEILYRRSRAEMPASSEEIRDAQEEGIKFNYLKAPVKILAKDGKVTGLEYIKMKLGEPDGSGRRRPIPIKGSEAQSKTNMVIAATGQRSDLAFISGKDGVETTDWGSIKADPVTFKTSVEGIFAGGDCVSGPATLIEALNAGNKVAFSIDCALQGKSFADTDPFAGVETGAQRETGLVVRKGAAKVSFLDVARRIEDVAEVEGGFSIAEARAEAARCLRCYRLMVWE